MRPPPGVVARGVAALVEAQVDRPLLPVEPSGPAGAGSHRDGARRGVDEPVEQRGRPVAAELEQLEAELVLAGAQVPGQLVGLQAVHVALGVGIEAALAADLDAVDQHPAGPVGADQDLGGRGLARQRHARAERDDRALGDAAGRAHPLRARVALDVGHEGEVGAQALDALRRAQAQVEHRRPGRQLHGARGEVPAALEVHRAAVEPRALDRRRADREERGERAVDMEHGTQVDGLAGRDGPEVEELLGHPPARPEVVDVHRVLVDAARRRPRGGPGRRHLPERRRQVVVRRRPGPARPGAERRVHRRPPRRAGRPDARAPRSRRRPRARRGRPSRPPGSPPPRPPTVRRASSRARGPEPRRCRRRCPTRAARTARPRR